MKTGDADSDKVQVIENVTLNYYKSFSAATEIAVCTIIINILEAM